MRRKKQKTRVLLWTVAAFGVSMPPVPAHGASLEVCRTVDNAPSSGSPLLIPGGSLFRDDGRADDPLAAFTGDRWQLRLETIVDMTIPGLQQCVRILVRITSDSAVKSVSLLDGRRFVYAGSSSLFDQPVPSEELLSLKGKVVDQVP